MTNQKQQSFYDSFTWEEEEFIILRLLLEEGPITLVLNEEESLKLSEQLQNEVKERR